MSTPKVLTQMPGLPGDSKGYTSPTRNMMLDAPMEWIWWHMWDRRWVAEGTEHRTDRTPQQDHWLEVMWERYPKRFGRG